MKRTRKRKPRRETKNELCAFIVRTGLPQPDLIIATRIEAGTRRAHFFPPRLIAPRFATPKSFTIATVIASSTSSAGLLFIM